jgi:GTP-binding protein
VDQELEAYGQGLPAKPKLVVLNKADLLDEVAINAVVDAVSARGEGKGWMTPRPLVVSAATSRGLEPLLEAIWRQLDHPQSS